MNTTTHYSGMDIHACNTLIQSIDDPKRWQIHQRGDLEFIVLSGKGLPQIFGRSLHTGCYLKSPNIRCFPEGREPLF